MKSTNKSAPSATQQGIRALRTNLSQAWKNDRRLLFKSVTAWVLFSGIIIVFVFLGNTPNHQGVATGGSAASVNGQIISLAEYSEQVEIMSRDPRFAQFEQFGADFAKRWVSQQAIQSLVDQRLLGQNLGKLGLTTPDAQIRDAITEIPAFQEDGRFSKTRYLGYLQATRQNPGEFEEKIRRQLSTGRVARSFSAALRPLPIESELLKGIENKKVNVEVVEIPTETLVVSDGIPSVEVKTFLDKSENKTRVKSYFDSHQADFSKPEQAKVRHILVKAEKGNADQVSKAKAEAEAIVKSLKSGADFAKLAQEKSQDPGSAKQGGVIDYFARGAMVPEFEAYAFSGKVGEISEPVQTDFGFHVIKIEDRRAATSKTLEEVQDDIAQILIAQDRSREEIVAIEKALAAGDQAAVQALLAKHKLTWHETGSFAITANELPKVGGGDEAVTSAFRLTKEKPLADKLVRQGPRALLLRYKSSGVEVAKADPKAPATESPAYRAEAEASRRIDEAFGQWMDGLRKSAKISVNPEVGARTAAAN